MNNKNPTNSNFLETISYKEILLNIVLFSLFILIGVSIGFLIWSKDSPTNKFAKEHQPNTVVAAKTEESVKWKSYTNPTEGYKLEIPDYFKHAKYKQENSDALTPTDYWYTGELNADGKDCHTTGESIIIAKIPAKSYKNVFEQKPDKTVKVGGVTTSQYRFSDWIAIEPVEYKQSAYKISYVPPCDKPAGYEFPQRLDDFNRMIKSITFIDEANKQ